MTNNILYLKQKVKEMTQKLKISIVETVRKEEEISSEEAASMLYAEHVGPKHNFEFYSKVRGYVPNTVRWSNGKWYYIIKIESDPRPATKEEIKAWYLWQLDQIEQRPSLCFVLSLLEGKEFILEVESV